MFLKEHMGGHLYNFGVNRVFLHTLIHRAQPKKTHKNNNEDVKSGILRFRN